MSLAPPTSAAVESCIFTVTTPVAGSPATLRSLLSPAQRARLGKYEVWEIDLTPATQSVTLQDAATLTDRATDLYTILVGIEKTVSSIAALDQLFIASANVTPTAVTLVCRCIGTKA
jgi:hypothetical protein